MKLSIPPSTPNAGALPPHGSPGDQSPPIGVSRAFLLIISIIVIMWGLAIYSLHRSHDTVDTVLHNSMVVRLIKEGIINLSKAIYLIEELENVEENFNSFEQRNAELAREFASLAQVIAGIGLKRSEQESADRFMAKGKELSGQIERIIPIHRTLANYMSHYDGERRLYSEILAERELKHYLYIIALRRSVDQKKLLVDTFDVTECGFHRWHTSEPIRDPDIREIIEEEMFPLHTQLHDDANRVKGMIEKGRFEEAHQLLDESGDNLARLGAYFSGIRQIAQTDYNLARQQLLAQEKTARQTYAEAGQAAEKLQTYLQEVNLQASLATMKKTTFRGRVLIWFFGLSGLLLSLFIARTTWQRLVRWSDELKSSNQRLETARQEIITSREAAERANRLKSEFLANMSHELRTPMHGILSFSAMGMEKVERASTEKLRRYFTRINDSGNRLLALLNDLLDLSKLEAGRMDFRMEKNDLRAIVTTLEEELQGLLKDKSITILQEPSTCPTIAVFDHDRVLQVARNMLSNAIKFSPENGVIFVSFNEKSGAGRDSDGPPSQMVGLSVTDQGYGVPEDEVEAVFDKFIQSSKTKSGQGGTGLGLSISREIILAHQGEITITNSESHGACIEFFIPRAQPIKKKKKMLGEILVESGHISKDQLEEVLKKQAGG